MWQGTEDKRDIEVTASRANEANVAEEGPCGASPEGTLGSHLPSRATRGLRLEQCGTVTIQPSFPLGQAGLIPETLTRPYAGPICA